MFRIYALGRVSEAREWWIGTLHLQGIRLGMLLNIYFLLYLNVFFSGHVFQMDYFFFRSEKLRVLFVSTLIIKPFLSRPRKKFAEHTRSVCPLFVNHHVCCQSIAFISVCKTLCV